MAFTKFQENWFRIDEEIAENYAILVKAAPWDDINFCF